jgi:16S rRNA (guanine(966)-N(2))-methyltransferase RsmD
VRIIAGRFKGRRLTAPVGRDVRPTSDALRETLFNVLAPSMSGARVLDAFAGTGALGLEAVSRGAASVVFVERDRAALTALDANIDACGARNACAIIRGDFLTARVDAPFECVLVDPPYEIADPAVVLDRAAGFVAEGGRLVFEHSRRRPSAEQAGRLRRARVITAGDSALSFYEDPGGSGGGEP